MTASILSILSLVSAIALTSPTPPPDCHRWRLAGIVLGESREQAEISLRTKLKLVGSAAEENAYMIESSEPSQIRGVTFRHGNAKADVSAVVISIDIAGGPAAAESELRDLRNTCGSPLNEQGRGFLYAESARLVEWRDEGCSAFAIMLIGKDKSRVTLTSQLDRLNVFRYSEDRTPRRGM